MISNELKQPILKSNEFELPFIKIKWIRTLILLFFFFFFLFIFYHLYHIFVLLTRLERAAPILFIETGYMPKWCARFVIKPNILYFWISCAKSQPTTPDTVHHTNTKPRKTLCNWIITFFINNGQNIGAFK